MPLAQDPLINIIYVGIKKPIQLCLENDAQRAALILMFAAIDSFAKLCMPEDQEKTTRADYAAWCEKYLNLDPNEKIEGLEWFAARSGLLHNYTAESKLSKDGKVRMIGYFTGEGPNIVYKPEESERLVMVRVEGLFEVFFSAIDAFVVDLYKDIDHEVIESRFNKMFSSSSYEA